MKYKPQSRVRFDWKERKPTPDEERMITFLQAGLDYTLAQLEVAKKNNKFGSCHDLQIQALTLANTIDAFRAGYHDENHPSRVIEPKGRARFLYGLIPDLT